MSGPLEANTPIVRANALVERIGDEVLVIDPTAHRFQTMNAAGEFLWSELAATTTIIDLAAALATRFGLDHATAMADTKHFVDDLHRRGYLATE